MQLAGTQRVCFNPFKRWQLRQNKETLFECIFAHSLGAYAHRVFLARSPLGYIMGFYIVMENEQPKTQFALMQWATNFLYSLDKVLETCERTIVYKITHTHSHI